MMKAISFTSFAAILVLGACSHYSEDLASMEGKMPVQPMQMAMAASPQDIAPAAGGPVSSETLNAALARSYFEMAKYENNTAYDYKAAKQYTQKAMMAAEGKVVAPFKVSAFDVPSEKAGEISSARAQLVAALQTQNMPENQQALAKAQTSFDCWIERAEEAADDAHYAQCQSDFQQSMAMLTAPAAGSPMNQETAYDIKFAVNTAVMDEASQKTLEYVANYLAVPENAGYTAVVTGYTGVVQGEFANNVMNARVKAVSDALAQKNVEPTRINPVVSAAPAETAKVQISLVPPANAVGTHTTTEYVPVTPREVPANTAH